MGLSIQMPLASAESNACYLAPETVSSCTDSTDFVLSETETLRESSVCSTIAAEALLPEDDLPDGTLEDVSKVSKFRQKLDRPAGGLPGRASVLSESGVPISENTNFSSHQPQATSTANEETFTEENAQFIEVKKIEARSNIAQQLYGVGKSKWQPRIPPAVTESSRAVPSYEIVKATLEKTTGSDGVRVSKFQAKLSETKTKGEFPAVKKK